MKSNLSFALTTLLFLSSCASSPTAQKADAQPVNPNSVSIDASQSIQFPMTPAEKKRLTADFKKAQANEEKALAKKEKTEMKALTTDQNARRKAWTAQEKKDRHAFFAQHMSGAERREYIQAYLKRKNDFDQSLKNETNTAKQSWKEKHDYLKKLQSERDTQFKANMDQNKRPDASLWPKE
jgi:Skp family chaperone for outer membrane proteins